MYPDRQATLIRNHPFMTQLDFFDMQEDQERAWAEQARQREAIQLAQQTGLIVAQALAMQFGNRVGARAPFQLGNVAGGAGGGGGAGAPNSYANNYAYGGRDGIEWGRDTLNGCTGCWTNLPGGDGGTNTGGGGGGGAHYNSNNKGGNGGSGIVIIRYKKK